MSKDKNTVIGPREMAYLAILAALKEEAFVSDVLDKWQRESQPSSVDYRLAFQLACGTVQMATALDYLSIQLTNQKKLSLKLKEKVILRMAIYQVFFLDRIPLYAIANEMQLLAHHYCHQRFVGFLNAILRRASQFYLKLPQEDNIQAMSIRYSYPPYFVELLIRSYGLDMTKQILAVGNRSSPVMVRVRGVNETASPSMAVLTDLSHLHQISTSPDYYIQNKTPVTLMHELCRRINPPSRLLDLCASPGGKLLFAHDAFPSAELYGNDVSIEKLQKIKENCLKYGIRVELNCGLGEEYKSQEPFDLIILDVPCSNSGVLNKRPEARWRLYESAIVQLEHVQLKLIQHAITLLNLETAVKGDKVMQDFESESFVMGADHSQKVKAAPITNDCGSKDCVNLSSSTAVSRLKEGGKIWYMTCSILPQENEELVYKACQLYQLKLEWQKLILPSADGSDGGYAAILGRQ